MIALFPASGESGGSACADVAESLALLGQEGVAPAGQEFLFVLSRDIGDFQPMLGHRCRLLPWERSMRFRCRVSKELLTDCKRCSDTFRCRAVVRLSAWPSMTWMVRRSAPASSIWVAQAWRNRSGKTGRAMPARRPALRHKWRMDPSSSGSLSAVWRGTASRWEVASGSRRATVPATLRRGAMSRGCPPCPRGHG